MAQISTHGNDDDGLVINQPIRSAAFKPVASIRKDKKKGKRASIMKVSSKRLASSKLEHKGDKALFDSILESFRQEEIDKLRENFNLEDIMVKYNIRDAEQLMVILSKLEDEHGLETDFFQMNSAASNVDLKKKDESGLNEQFKPPKLHLSELRQLKVATTSATSYRKMVD